MVKCKKCGDEDYGINMVVEDSNFLCPACATECIINQKKKNKKLKKKIKKNKDFSIKEKDALKQTIIHRDNWIGTVTKALDIPADSSSGKVLDKISELRNRINENN